MDEEYLTPGFDYSYSTPFKKAFNNDQCEDPFVPKSNSTFGENEDPDLSFINNFQRLALSDKQSRYKNYPLSDSTVSPHHLDGSMGVAESKENHENESPSFLSFGDTPKKLKPETDQKSIVDPLTEVLDGQVQSVAEPLTSPQKQEKESLNISELQSVSEASSPSPPVQEPRNESCVSPKVPSSFEVLSPPPLQEPITETFVCPKAQSVLEALSPLSESNKENEVIQDFQTLSLFEPSTPPQNLQKESSGIPEIQSVAEVSPPLRVSKNESFSVPESLVSIQKRQLQAELDKQEELFQKQLEEQDAIIADRQQELEALRSKLQTVTEQKEADSKLIKKKEAKMTQCATELEKLKTEYIKKESEKIALIHEREQAFSDLRNVENAYNDLLGKYVRAKEVVMSYSKNQESLVAQDESMMQKVDHRDKKIDMISSQVQENLERMHQEYEGKLREKKMDHENMRVRLMKMEMRVDTLENDLEQKSEENAKLHKLCDEILNGRVAN